MSAHPDWTAKRVLLLGFGAEGRASLRFAVTCGARHIAIADRADTVSIPADDAALVSRIFSGSNWLAGLYDFDIIVRSPGVPLRHLADLHRAAPHTVVTSGTNIFLARHRARTIGVTGTKGKSTTTSLIHHMLTSAAYDAQLGGNIGIPALTLFEKSAALYVMEFSSYQLADADHSPHVAVFLNIYPEHLDHHESFELYCQAKTNIAQFQTPADLLVLPSGTDPLHQLTAHAQAERVLWGSPEETSWIENKSFYYRAINGDTHHVCRTTEPLLKGPGNQRNILAALAAVRHLSLQPETLATAICTFCPLPHRLEEVGVVDGITYVNDSISTVPEATINALETFGPAVATILLGGFDRGVSFTGLVDYLMHTKVQTIILFPPSGVRIGSAMREHPLFSENPRTLIEVTSMEEAVAHAAVVTPASSVCLLSPASPSFPLFTNFEQRGAAFRAAVLAGQKHATDSMLATRRAN